MPDPVRSPPAGVRGKLGEIKIIVDRTKDLTINTAIGKISKDDMAAAIQAYLPNNPTGKLLWNFLEADGSEISGREFHRLQMMVSDFPAALDKGKIALVASRDLGFGLSRLAQTYAEISEVRAEYGIFRSLEEDFVWLE